MLADMANETAAEPSNGEQTPPDVVVRGNARGFLQEIVSGGHHLRADEPESVGGTDLAPDPYDYLLAGLGACTSMTVGLFARKKKWPLEDVTVALRRTRIHATDCADCETTDGMLDHIDVEVALSGDLTDAQRATLMGIAHKCPVHRTLKSEIKISVRPAEAGPSSAATS
jgi:putative redox protein